MLDQRPVDGGRHPSMSRDTVLISVDLEGRILGWSPSAERMFDIRACDIVGAQLSAVMFETPDAERRARLRLAIETVEVLDGPSTFIDRSGAAIDVYVTAVPVMTASGRIERVDLIVVRLERAVPMMLARAAEDRITELARTCALDIREVEMLALLATGHRVATIARHLHLAQGTVRNALSALYVKLGVACQGEVVELLLGDRDLAGAARGPSTKPVRSSATEGFDERR
jgi:PAS domain S-box-containing protein